MGGGGRVVKAPVGWGMNGVLLAGVRAPLASSPLSDKPATTHAAPPDSNGSRFLLWLCAYAVSSTLADHHQHRSRERKLYRVGPNCGPTLGP